MNDTSGPDKAVVRRAMPLSIVVLMNSDSLYGRRLLWGLKSAGIPISAVIIKQPLSYSVTLFRHAARHVGTWDAFKQGVHRVLLGRHANHIYRQTIPEAFGPFETLAKRVINVPGTNTPQTVEALKKLIAIYCCSDNAASCGKTFWPFRRSERLTLTLACYPTIAG